MREAIQHARFFVADIGKPCPLEPLVKEDARGEGVAKIDDRVRPQMEANGIMEWEGRHDIIYGDCEYYFFVVY